MPTLSEALAIAMGHHRSGRLELAEEIYRRILAIEPNQPDALHLTGLVAHHRGRSAEAIDWMRRAIALDPGQADYHNNLADANRALGRLDDATAGFRRAVELRPDLPQFRTNLAHALLAQAKVDEAIAQYRRAIEQDGRLMAAHRGLGGALRIAGRLEEAVACYRHALEVEPDDSRAYNDLGIVLRTQGKTREAAECYRRAIAIQPDFAEALSNLGVTWQDLGDQEQAVDCCHRALAIRPNFPEASNNLGNALQSLGKLVPAVDSYQRALALRPEFTEAWSNLGNALQDLGNFDEAVACYRRAIALRPSHAKSHNDLGTALRRKGDLDEAIACYQRALALQPELVEVHNNLGTAMKELGRLDEAVACYQRALDLAPGLAMVRSNLLFTQQYREGVTRAELAAAHAEYDRLHAGPLRATWTPHANVCDPERPLRVGFVSFDLARHPVGQFLVRLLENLDHSQAQAVCYSLRPVADEITVRCRAASALWRDVFAMPDEQLAAAIRQDRIDILFDLGGHTAQNRLLVFARKPAPIQVTWAGYVGTTGLETMDYLLADRYHVPPEAETDYCEQVLRMPNGYVAFDPPADAPSPGPLPALASERVTFGSFNNLSKVTPGVVALWAAILRRVPGARLFLQTPALGTPSARSRLVEQFAAQAVEPDRLEFGGPLAPGKFLAQYQRVDVALDTFPYSGGLTTLEALWMGVPVVTWPGETFAGRHSLSHLSNVGLLQTIAGSSAEYVETAVRLAVDVPRLAEIRSGLRQQVARSPLCDGRQFAADWMQVLRDVWREWCRR